MRYPNFQFKVAHEFFPRQAPCFIEGSLLIDACKSVLGSAVFSEG